MSSTPLGCVHRDSFLETDKNITEPDEMFDDVMRSLLYVTVSVPFCLVQMIKTKESLRLVFFFICDVLPLTICLETVICDLGEVDSVLVAFVTIRWTLLSAGSLLEQNHCGNNYRELNHVVFLLWSIHEGKKNNTRF